ncbi:hypothetical protein [Pseudoxanthomonas mexicana]|uniref:hypothetical protein n=1 Tax=Pseudoxanthomonas mexicana TaxID=128785 RepID=UPI0028A7A33E|nr:hypothetical protein [Pseudoxanthomonas mexicana]
MRRHIIAIENILLEIARLIASSAAISFLISSLSIAAPNVPALRLSHGLLRHYPETFISQMSFWFIGIILLVTSVVMTAAPGLERFVRECLARPALRISTHMFALSSGLFVGWYFAEVLFSTRELLSTTTLQVIYIGLAYFSFAFNTAIGDKLISRVHLVYQKRYGDLVAPVSLLVAIVLAVIAVTYFVPRLGAAVGAHG